MQKGAIKLPQKNFGTPEGRRKGGLASLITHQRKKDGFVLLKKITIPQKSEKLAEFLGIMIGDGHLTDYQLSVTTNSETDMEHARFTAKIIKDLFDIEAKIQNRQFEKAVVIVASSKSAVDFIHSLGMPIGDKIKNHVAMPDWIIANNKYQKAFLRGMFDTDGSIFLDRHLINNNEYYNIGWTITAYADKLRADICQSLWQLGFSPNCTFPQLSVFLRRHNDIERFFSEIGSHNEKHIARYQKFLAQCK
ncbi:MAG: hypothetical protein KGJ13_04290 [Patescibacteria group bacterium]|nr:hypothetical protein [Patescibacteria group bacterium]